MDWGPLFTTVLAGLAPTIPYFAGVAVFLIVLRAPVPGRGPGRSQGRDPWRRFKYESRRAVMERAGRVYQAVWDTEIDPRNFQRKVLSATGFVEKTGEIIRGRGRPAKVYRAGEATALHPAIMRR